MQDNLVGQNIIITERLGALRQLGRNALRGKWGSAIIAMILVILCISAPLVILNNLFGMKILDLIPNAQVTLGMTAEQYTTYYNAYPDISPVAMLYTIIVTGPFTLGLSLFFLASFRGHKVTPKDIFLGFERFGKSLGLFILIFIKIYLWALLFIIPGIIASIRYSQAFFVLADDPDKSITQCINESKQMMKGNKMKYFLLSLSFFGWLILANIPGMIITGIAQTMTVNVTALAVVSILASVFTAPVNAYMLSTTAGFYEILAGHLIKETVPSPVTADQIDVEAPIEHIEEVIESVEEAAQDNKELDTDAKIPETSDLEEGMPKEPRIDVENILKNSEDNIDNDLTGKDK